VSATPIDPKDIRPRDRIRVTDIYYRTVVQSDEHGVRVEETQTGSGRSWFASDPALDPETFVRTFHLLDRPKPEAKPRTFWRDPETGAAWVRTHADPNRPGDVHYLGVSVNHLGDLLIPCYEADQQIIDRLIPEDAS
jgi:hypothetical protein